VTETFTTRSVRGTVKLGRELAERFGRGDCLALVGPLGAGKTVLVRGLTAGWGVPDERCVASPTFVLVREYEGTLPVFHMDLYRLDHADADLPGLGLAEMLSEGVVVIEWADRAGEGLPKPHWRIDIEPTGPRSRTVRLAHVV